MQKYRSNATAIIANKRIQVKTDRDVEQALGIKTDQNPTTKNHRSPNVKESIEDKSKFISKIGELQKENQRFVNGDKEDRMAIKLNDKDTTYLTVATIPSDGNCLFSAIAHQLYRYPINSKVHNDATKELRAQVIEHILDPVNFPSYQFTLQDRVYEIKTSEEIQNMTNECKLYVRHVLSKDGKWGGHESISAIGEIHQLNITTFNEEGTRTLQTNPIEKI